MKHSQDYAITENSNYIPQENQDRLDSPGGSRDPEKKEGEREKCNAVKGFTRNRENA